MTSRDPMHAAAGPPGSDAPGRQARIAGIVLVALGCLFLVVRGVHDEETTMHSRDLKPIYGAAHCLLANCNPYHNTEIRAQYIGHGGQPGDESPFQSFYLNYPPSTLALFTPLALLPWKAAHVVWLAIILTGFCAGVFAVAELCLPFSPVMTGLLLALFLATSLLMVMLGQPTLLAIGLCVLGVNRFLRQRNWRLGVVCFALSLALKPPLGGLVLVYFLLAGRIYRRRALQTIALAVLISLPGLLWASIMPASRNWRHDLARNLKGMASDGRRSDPGPRSVEAWDLANGQSIAALARDDPSFYNPVTYAGAALLLALWCFPVFKLRPGQTKDLLCVAAISCISMLPLYHRAYDTRLLMLTFPAIALLLARRRPGLGIAAFVLALCTTVMTFSQLDNLHPPYAVAQALAALARVKALSVFVLRPVSSACIVSSLFYLACCYLQMLAEKHGNPEATQPAA